MAFFSFGNLAIDDLVFADGSTLWNIAGGAALYSALGMAVWADATVIAPFGPDYPLEELPGIEFAGARRLLHSMRNWGLYEDDGSRHFLSRRGCDWESASPQVDDLGQGPYTFCHLGPMPWNCADALIGALRLRGARTISLDIHDHKLACVTLEQYVALVSRVDVFLPSTQDVAEFYPNLTPIDALRALRDRLPSVAVLGVKRGGAGAIIHAQGDTRIINVPAAPEVEVVDVTGAGDAFCGGFLAGYACGGDVGEGAVRGTISAAYAVSAQGSSGLRAVDRRHARQRLARVRDLIDTSPLRTR